MPCISKRLKMIKPSATLAIVQKTMELKKLGKNIINLNAGEPEFDTPNYIKQAGIEAIKQGFTKYTDVSGIKELKEAIQQKTLKEKKINYSLDEIIVSTGAKQVIYNLFMTSLNSKDEVIIFKPYWTSYPDIIKLSQGKPVFIETNITNGFKIDFKILEERISKKTKWIIINSPNNPTGIIYSTKELEKLAKILELYPKIKIMSDEIYENILFEQSKCNNILTIAPEFKNRVFIVNGLSKTYAMTGWRIGYGLGDKNLIKGMNTIQSQSTSNACSISQIAAIKALTSDQDIIKINSSLYSKRLNMVFSMIKDIKGLDCIKPEGAFYLFVQCDELLGKQTPKGKIIKTSIDLTDYLLEEAETSVIPGEAFGLKGYFRISYTTSLENLKEGCDRIKTAFNKLK